MATSVNSIPYTMQTPKPDLAKAALMFEDSQNRFDDRFALAIDSPTHRVAESSPHLPMLRISNTFAVPRPCA
jgi:hypothetical protein